VEEACVERSFRSNKFGQRFNARITRQLSNLYVAAADDDDNNNKVHKTITVPVVLYGCSWSPTLREEQRLKVFEDGMLKRILGPRKDEVRGGCRCIMRSSIICTLHQLLFL
jgi:hypothetical protein